jgi:hypothetical protein
VSHKPLLFPHKTIAPVFAELYRTSGMNFQWLTMSFKQSRSHELFYRHAPIFRQFGKWKNQKFDGGTFQHYDLPAFPPTIYSVPGYETCFSIRRAPLYPVFVEPQSIK